MSRGLAQENTRHERESRHMATSPELVAAHVFVSRDQLAVVIEQDHRRERFHFKSLRIDAADGLDVRHHVAEVQRGGVQDQGRRHGSTRGPNSKSQFPIHDEVYEINCVTCGNSVISASGLFTESLKCSGVASSDDLSPAYSAVRMPKHLAGAISPRFSSRREGFAPAESLGRPLRPAPCERLSRTVCGP